MSTIRQHTGHDWTPTAPKDPAPPQRENANVLWPWSCTTCKAYAEVAEQRAPGESAMWSAGRIPLPGKGERERWGVEATCEEQTVKEVHES